MQRQDSADPRRFEQMKAELGNVYRRIAEVPKLRLKKFDDLKRNQRLIQLTAFLDQHEIERARINGLNTRMWPRHPSSLQNRKRQIIFARKVGW
jgi:hypothetical protein